MQYLLICRGEIVSVFDAVDGCQAAQLARNSGGIAGLVVGSHEFQEVCAHVHDPLMEERETRPENNTDVNEIMGFEETLNMIFGPGSVVKVVTGREELFNMLEKDFGTQEQGHLRTDTDEGIREGDNRGGDSSDGREESDETSASGTGSTTGSDGGHSESSGDDGGEHEEHSGETSRDDGR